MCKCPGKASLSLDKPTRVSVIKSMCESALDKPTFVSTGYALNPHFKWQDGNSCEESLFQKLKAAGIPGRPYVIEMLF
jgi:hypothetical protein